MSDHAQQDDDSQHHHRTQPMPENLISSPGSSAPASSSPSLMPRRRSVHDVLSQPQHLIQQESSSPLLATRSTLFHSAVEAKTEECGSADLKQQLLLPKRHSKTGELSRRLTVLQEEGPIAEPINSSSFICGLLAGIAQAGVFNPYDRALYLSVRDNRPFLHPINWSNPYNGFMQSISGRAIQGGLYFPLEHFFLHTLHEYHTTMATDNTTKSNDGNPKLNFLAGTAAGAVNAVLLNPISAVKYKTWGRDVNNGLFHEVVGMIRKSGFSIRPFYNGVIPTVMRDVVFGGTYTWLRLQIKTWFSLSTQQQWLGNFVAAGLATILSGPFNYVRTIQFATRSHEFAPSTVHILSDLMNETLAIENKHIFSRLQYLQMKLRIGWGTARVAIGMTFAHSVYNWLHDTIKPQVISLK